MFEAILTLVSVVTLLLGSPGPAPLALAAVGAGFGFRRGLPFLLGILVGLLFAIAAATAGLSTLLAYYPTASIALQLVGGIYILYLAIKIATAPVFVEGETITYLPKFTDGLLLNLLNPKAYAAFLAIFTQFVLPLDNQFWAVLSTATVCMIVASIVDALWLVAGNLIRPVFTKPLAARVVRLLFSVMMVAAVLWSVSKSIH